MPHSVQDLFITPTVKNLVAQRPATCHSISKQPKGEYSMFSLSQFPLPFADDALAPYISAETLRFHHGKHVATYINNLNDLIAGTEYENMPLHDIIVRCAQNPSQAKIFNNAAQVYNHDFFFNCMRRDDKTNIPYEIEKFFGGPDKFRDAFKSAATSVFGSGWTWLVQDGDTFKIINTANADTPIAHGMRPLLTLDVWEHAYYLDYQNKRAEYCDAFLNHLINWQFALENMQK